MVFPARNIHSNAPYYIGRCSICHNKKQCQYDSDTPSYPFSKSSSENWIIVLSGNLEQRNTIKSIKIIPITKPIVMESHVSAPSFLTITPAVIPTALPKRRFGIIKKYCILLIFAIANDNPTLHFLVNLQRLLI